MRGPIARTLAIVLSVASLGAAQRPASSESVNTGNKVSPAKSASTKPYQVGTASWYGDYFQGKTTASGEPYDMYDLTAAHPPLPLGRMVPENNPPRRRQSHNWSRQHYVTSLPAQNPLNSP